MDSFHSSARASSASSARVTTGVVLVALAAYALGMWGARELVQLVPYTVEVNLLVPRLDLARLARVLRVLPPLLGAALIATALVRRGRGRR